MSPTLPQSKFRVWAVVRLVVPSFFVLASLLLPGIALANNIPVTGLCTLPEAIQAANTDSVTTNCPAGSGTDTLLLTASPYLVSYDALFDNSGSNATPSIVSTIIISGGVSGAVVERTGADDARLFHVDSTGNLTLINVTLQKGRVSLYSGGAIYNRGTLTLLDSRLFSNEADQGGAIYNAFGATATFTNTQIVTNTSLNSSGGIYNDGTATLNGSNLISNRAQNAFGGGFYNNGTATLTNSDLISNTVQNGSGGGFFNSGTATLTNSDLISNTVQNGSGGGFFNGSKATLTNSDLISNTVQNGSGGGFFNGDTITLINSDLISNTAQFDGGGFYNGETATITNSAIISNTAERGGGFYNNRIITLTDSDITANTATLEGGGFRNAGTASLTNSDIISNTAQNGVGGGFSTDGTSVTLINSDLISNTTQTDGGGFHASSGASINLTDSDLISNTAQGNGGGFITTQGATATLTNTRIINNQAASGGGYYNENRANLKNSTVIANHAQHGGGYYNTYETTLANTTLQSNTATEQGGGFYNDTNSTSTLTNTQLISNTANTQGGGFYNDDSATASLTDSALRGNVAQADGGGFYNVANATVTLINSLLHANITQGGSGGGFLNSSLGTTNLTDSTVSSNTAQTDSGGGFLNDGTVTLTDTLLLSNTAQSGGGFMNNGSATLTRAAIHGNRGTNYGGGFSNFGTVTLLGTTIRANQAVNEGGGFSNSSDATITGGEISGNIANKGGGFYNIATATLTQVKILENVAINNGGALFQDFTGTTTVNQSCIVGNNKTAVNRNNGSTIDAQNNWWGAADGPSPVGVGAGDSVSSGVDFAPFQATAILACPLRQAQIAFHQRVSPAGNLMPGQPMSYTLTITNIGTLPVYNLHISHLLPPTGFVLESIAAKGAPVRISNNTTIFTTTAPSRVVTVTVSGHVDGNLSNDLQLTNVGMITSPVLALLSDSVDANVVVPELHWSSATYQGQEGGGALNVTLLLAPINPYITVTVQTVITDTYGAIGAISERDVSFPPGSGSQTLLFQPVDDEAFLTQTVQLALNAPVGASLGNPSRATISYVENDVEGLSVSISANVTQASVGDLIFYTYRITNTGNVTFTLVTASDDLIGTVAELTGELPPNVARTATLPYLVKLTDLGALVNTVTATGTRGLGETITDEDSYTVTVTKPRIFLPSLERTAEIRQ